MRKPPYALLGLFLITLFFITNCKKSDFPSFEKNDQENILNLSIADANSWFKQNSESLSIANRNGRGEKFSNPIPDWAKASNAEDKDWYVVEVPVVFDRSIGFNIDKISARKPKPATTKTNLLVLKNKHSLEVSAVLMHIVALQDESLQSVNYTKRSNFSGTIFYTDLEGGLINGWVYETGKIKASMLNKSEGGVKRAALPEEDCITIITDWYERDCIYYSNGSEQCTEWMYTHSTYQTICPVNNGGGGGGGGGPTPPSPSEENLETTSHTFYEEIEDVDDESPNAGINAPRIKYTFHCRVISGETSKKIYRVEVDPITADPMLSTYIDNYNRNTNRRLTLFNQVKSATILSHSSALVNWSCLVNGFYTYTDGSPSKTRNWPVSKNQIVYAN